MRSTFGVLAPVVLSLSRDHQTSSIRFLHLLGRLAQSAKSPGAQLWGRSSGVVCRLDNCLARFYLDCSTR